MFKTRALLVALALFNVPIFVLGVKGFDRLVVENSITIMENVLVCFYFVAIVVPPFVFTSSLMMFFLSFFNLKTTVDGRLVYDPKNWYWKLLKKMFDFKSDVISLCVACWLTALLFFILFFCLLLLLIVVLFAWTMMNYGINQDALENCGRTLVFFTCFIAWYVTFLWLLKKSGEKNHKRENLKAWLYFFLAFVLLIVLLVVWPLVSIMKNNELSFFPATLIYLKSVSLFLGLGIGLLIIANIVLALFKFMAGLGPDNLFKRFLLMTKNNACPRIFSSEDQVLN